MKEDEYMCLSFNNFGLSSENAAKIFDEFQVEKKDSLNGCEEDFEFSLVSGNSKKSFFPLFNRDLLLSDSDLKNVDKSTLDPLKDLFLKKSESTTSSEAEEVETIPTRIYCMWKTKISEPLPGKCNKNKSTGFVSKRWPRIRDLLRRSNSEDKEEDSYVFLTRKAKSKNSSEMVKTTGKLKQTKVSGGGKGLPAPAASEYAVYYVGIREGDKNRRKSYLPYRKELIRFFAIGLSRSYRPF